MEDGGTGGDEDFVFNRTTDNVSVRADETVVTKLERMTSIAPEDRVLHHYAFGSNLDRTSFRDDLRAEKNSGACADDDIAAYSRVWRDIGCGVDPWRFALMCDEHGET